MYFYDIISYLFIDESFVIMEVDVGYVFIFLVFFYLDVVKCLKEEFKWRLNLLKIDMKGVNVESCV